MSVTTSGNLTESPVSLQGASPNELLVDLEGQLHGLALLVKKILLLAVLLLPAGLLAQIRTFPYEESGLDAAKPGSCTTPYFYNAIGFLNYCRSGVLVSAGRTGTRMTASGLGQILVSTRGG